MLGVVKFKVDASHLVDFAGSGMPAVLSTPCLIGFLERAGREALKPLLDDDENSVGTEIEIKHLAPTPPGHTVTCTAKVIFVDGALINFAVEASDEMEVIARGTHRRAVIRVDRFTKRVERKTLKK